MSQAAYRIEIERAGALLWRWHWQVVEVRVLPRHGDRLAGPSPEIGHDVMHGWAISEKRALGKARRWVARRRRREERRERTHREVEA